MNLDGETGMGPARSDSGRAANRKASLEVFGGAPRLMQAGVFSPVRAAEPVLEDKAPRDSSLFESMMSAASSAAAAAKAAPSSSLTKVERSLSARALLVDEAAAERVSEPRRGRNLSQGVLRDVEELGASVPHRRYSLQASSAAVASRCRYHAEGPACISDDVQRALSSFQQTFLVTDALRPDCPILFASACFLAMTGYSQAEVAGRNCRFLQGPATDRAEVARIRDALDSGRRVSAKLLNYRKDGSAFWNLLTITPIRDARDRVVMFIGTQAEVSKHTEGCRELALRPNGLSASLIRYESRQIDQAADAVTEILGAFRRISLSAQLAGGDDDNHDDEDDERHSTSQRSTASAPRPPRSRRSGPKLSSLLGSRRLKQTSQDHVELLAMGMTSGDGDEDDERAQVIRRAIDLGTTLERIQKCFVITDPRLPDNPIIFASDQFLDLTEYAREDVLGRNCRFLQGPDTDPDALQQVRDAIAERRAVTVQLLNYTKSGQPFWNLFHMQAVRDAKGELQYFIGVQLSPQQRLSDRTERERAKVVQQTAMAVDDAVRELPDANLSPKRLWAIHSKPVYPKPHMQGSRAWEEILKARSVDAGHGQAHSFGLRNFRPIKLLGRGDTGSVHLVELRGTGQVFAMKTMEKAALLSRNKVHRVFAERRTLELLDHPFLPTLFASFQTATHVCLIMNFCSGSELSVALDQQPKKRFREESARFYAAEIIIALEYLHCLGVAHRDLKPENILIQEDGHLQLTDFDLSANSSANLQMMDPVEPKSKRRRMPMSLTSKASPKRRSKSINSKHPVFFAEPVASSNSFVGTEEYIAPEIITGHGHTSAVDWWSLGILLYEMLFGRTPFKGSNRQKTFANILEKGLVFPPNIPVSLEAQQLIQGLLAREPIKRLGSTLGAHDIKSHPFFRNTKWALVRCTSPPPLEVPVPCTESLADLLHNSALFEWDDADVQAASTFFEAF